MLLINIFGEKVLFCFMIVYIYDVINSKIKLVVAAKPATQKLQ